MIEALLFLHILLFIFSFAFTAGNGILAQKIAARGDANVTLAVFRASHPLSMAGGFGWILTALTGAWLAVTMGYDMTASWLLWSYAAFAVLILSGFLMHAPWHAKLIATPPGPELDALLKAPGHRIANILSAISVLAILYLMTARPG